MVRSNISFDKLYRNVKGTGGKAIRAPLNFPLSDDEWCRTDITDILSLIGLSSWFVREIGKAAVTGQNAFGEISGEVREADFWTRTI
jgi:hypothetical protein